MGRTDPRLWLVIVGRDDTFGQSDLFKKLAAELLNYFVLYANLNEDSNLNERKLPMARIASTRTSKKAKSAPVAVIPPLSKTIFGRFTVEIDGLGQVEVDLPCGASIARAFGLAYSAMTRHDGFYKGVACNVLDAFTLTSLDAGSNRIIGTLRIDAPTMELKSADNEFLDKILAAERCQEEENRRYRAWREEQLRRWDCAARWID